MKVLKNKGRRPPYQHWHFAAVALAILVVFTAFTLIFRRANRIESISENVTKTSASPVTPKVHEERLEACYINYLKTNPAHDEGSVVVNWEINQQGHIRSVHLVRNDLNNGSFSNCLLENLKKAQFTKTSDGTPATVAHRYEFKRRAPTSL